MISILTRLGTASILKPVFALAVVLVVMSMNPVFAKDTDYPEGKIKLFGKRYSLALSASYGDPLSSMFKDSFGNSGFGFGVRLFRPEMEKGWKFTPSTTFKMYKENDNEAVIIGLGAGVHYNFVDPKVESIVPYFSVHTGPYYVNLTDFKSEIVAGGGASLGVEFNDTVKFSVNYDLIGDVNGYDPSMWSAGVVVKVW
jgi:hypothetical protein